MIAGAPYGAQTPLLASISALSRLAIASLKEDSYGTVSKDVATLMRTFTAAENGIVRFVGGLAPHWTDVEFNDEQRRVEGVEEVLRVLREGLKGLVNEFGEYADELGLGMGEMRAAKEAVARAAAAAKEQQEKQKQGDAGSNEKEAQKQKQQTRDDRQNGEQRRQDGRQNGESRPQNREMAEKGKSKERSNDNDRPRERRTTERKSSDRGAGSGGNDARSGRRQGSDNAR